MGYDDEIGPAESSAGLTARHGSNVLHRPKQVFKHLCQSWGKELHAIHEANLSSHKAAALEMLKTPEYSTKTHATLAYSNTKKTTSEDPTACAEDKFYPRTPYQTYTRKKVALWKAERTSRGTVLSCLLGRILACRMRHCLKGSVLACQMEHTPRVNFTI